MRWRRWWGEGGGGEGGAKTRKKQAKIMNKENWLNGIGLNQKQSF